jgi:hypothetical protein
MPIVLGSDGTVTATAFVGDGSGLTDLPAGGHTFETVGVGIVQGTPYVSFTGLTNMVGFMAIGDYNSTTSRGIGVSYYNGSTWSSDTVFNGTSSRGSMDMLGDASLVVFHTLSGRQALSKTAPSGWSGVRFNATGSSAAWNLTLSVFKG